MPHLNQSSSPVSRMSWFKIIAIIIIVIIIIIFVASLIGGNELKSMMPSLPKFDLGSLLPNPSDLFGNATSKIGSDISNAAGSILNPVRNIGSSIKGLFH